MTSAAKRQRLRPPNISFEDTAIFEGPADIEDIVLKVQNGTPVYVKNIARVHLGGDLRRGVAELDGKGEVVGGIVVMRYGENALNVISGVKKKLQELQSSLPDGVQIIPTYDRSGIIKRAIANASGKADRRKHCGRAGLYGFSLACAIGARRDHHTCRLRSFYRSFRCFCLGRPRTSCPWEVSRSRLAP